MILTTLRIPSCCGYCLLQLILLLIHPICLSTCLCIHYPVTCHPIICHPIIDHPPLIGQPLVEKIRDAAGQKGTGKWTAISGLEYGTPTTLIAESVFARCLSALKVCSPLCNCIFTGWKNLILSISQFLTLMHLTLDFISQSISLINCPILNFIYLFIFFPWLICIEGQSLLYPQEPVFFSPFL